MSKKKILLSIGIISIICSFILTFIYYKSNNRLVIYTSSDSYAYSYAKRNLIKTVDVSESHYNNFHRVWEEFKYNEEKDGLIITKYVGNSVNLIIPTTYNNKKIIKIEKGALPTNLTSIFIPDSIKELNYDDFTNVEILCYRGEFCNNLKENKNLKVKVLDDVDRYILNEEDLEFTYNFINHSEIELTNYIGSDEIVVVPETINGYKVTSINFDGEGITSIFIPKTVNSISGNITSKLLNKCFIISTIIFLIALLTFTCSVLFSKFYDLIGKVYIYALSIIYLIVINYIVYCLRSNPLNSINYLVYSIIASIVYVIIYYLLSIIIKKNKEFDDDNKKVNSFIKEVQLLIDDYDFKELKEISEMIRFSDPVSIDAVKQIEKDIINIVKSIDKDSVDDKVKELKKLINKRNTIIKNEK